MTVNLACGSQHAAVVLAATWVIPFHSHPSRPGVFGGCHGAQVPDSPTVTFLVRNALAKAEVLQGVNSRH
jgi:hypothetical protein